MSFETIYPESKYVSGVGKIITIKEEKDYYDKFIIKIKYIENISNVKGTKVIVYIKKGNDLHIGDIVSFEGEFSKPSKSRNYRGFNYSNYLKQSKIYGTIKIERLEEIGHELDLIGSIKERLYIQIDRLFKDEYIGFLKGMLLGDNGNLDEKIEENFKNSDISHVIAISGMHVTYILFGINIVFDKVIQSKKLKNNILISILIFFAVITGLSPSCVRSCIMSGMVILSSNINRKNNFYVSLFISFAILIIFNVYNLFNVGMWLSFAGTLGIVVFHKFLKRLLECKFKIKCKIIEICLLSISAQILIIPIMAFVFNTVSFAFYIPNLLIHYLVGPILALGYISVLVGIFLPSVGSVIATIETMLIKLLFVIAEICSKISFSRMYITTPSFIFVILYYLVIILFIYYFKLNKFKALRLLLGRRLFKYVFKKIQNYNKENFCSNNSNPFNFKDYRFNAKGFKDIFYRCWARRLLFDS